MEMSNPYDKANAYVAFAGLNRTESKNKMTAESVGGEAVAGCGMQFQIGMLIIWHRICSSNKVFQLTVYDGPV